MLHYIIDFGLLALLYKYAFYTKWKQQSTKQFLVKTMMFIYISLVLSVTLMPFPMPFRIVNNYFYETINLIPFRDVILNHDRAVEEVILNIIMMMPFGFLYPIIRKVKLMKTVKMTFLFSLCIESTQLLSTWWDRSYVRFFDITDIITNTFGGLVGYIIYVAMKPVIDRVGQWSGLRDRFS